MLISADLCLMSELACSCRMPMQVLSNVSARVFISVDLCRMSQLACPFLLQVKIPSNVSAPVFISVDLCRMSQLLSSFPTPMQMNELITKGVRRQRNGGFILALIMSRMILMMIWSHHYQHQAGRALRQKNGGCRRVPEAGNDLHQEHYSVKQYITKSFS